MNRSFVETSSHQCGIAHAEDTAHKQSLTILVLPKSWNPNIPASGGYSQAVLNWPLHEKDGYLCLYENQQVQINLSPDSSTVEQDSESDTEHSDTTSPVEIRRALLNECLSRAKDVASDKSKKQKDSSKPPSPLISRTLDFDDTISVYTQSTKTKEELMLSMIKLITLLDFSKLTPENNQRFTKHPDDMLEPFLHRQFMVEMLKEYKSIRRGYVAKSATIDTIRGRVSPYSIARTEESGEQQLLCHYDEFEEGTPLMRVLVTALEVVSTGTWLSKANMDTQSLNSKPNLVNTHLKSIQVRRFLNTISAYPVRKALHIANTLRLNRMTANFSTALTYAKMILQKSQFLPLDTSQLDSPSWCWSEDMSDIWENILYKGFRQINTKTVKAYYFDEQIGDQDVYEPNVIPAAFGTGGNSVPDILLNSMNSNWVVDAKYSYFATSEVIPKAPKYRDQMFRYLFLMPRNETADDSPPWADHLVLLYTTNDTLIANKDGGLEVQSIWRTEWGERPKLYQYGVPFPTELAVESLSHWKEYKTVLASALSMVLDTNQQNQRQIPHPQK